MEPWQEKIETKVNDLERSQAQIDQLIDRFDLSIERLTEVSTTVSQLLAVQGSRLEFQEKTSVELSRLLEQRRVEGENVIKDVYVKIDNVEKDLLKNVDEAHGKILTELKDMRDELKTRDAKEAKKEAATAKKIEDMQKFQWKIFGGGVVLVGATSYFDILAKLFA